MEIISRRGPNGLTIEIYIPDQDLDRRQGYELWADLVDGLRRIVFQTQNGKEE